ncbi:hypothetical protein [Sphingobium fuliginis]|nr:hypothetical protein [Sphingobium fuliginis]
MRDPNKSNLATEDEWATAQQLVSARLDERALAGYPGPLPVNFPDL